MTDPPDRDEDKSITVQNVIYDNPQWILGRTV
jgi:hypothetical protein